MRRNWRKTKPKENKINFKSNYQIKAPEVFLIDEVGEKVGKIATEKAINMAKEFDLDLVEVNPKVNPPIAKIIDLGQIKYEAEKKAQKQKALQKKIDTKGIRLSARISRGDLAFRIKQAEKFLEKGNKLKIELNLRGRERQHPLKGSEVIKNFVEELRKNEDLNITEEQPLTKQGGRFIMVLLNKK